MAATGHTATVFDDELRALSRLIAEMGGLVEKQAVEAISALTHRDPDRGRQVVEADATIDAMQRTIEETAVETIARRQPVAHGGGVLRHAVSYTHLTLPTILLV